MILYSIRGWPVSLDMSCQKSLSAVACTFEFLNVAHEDYYLLKRNTPLEGLISQFIAYKLIMKFIERVHNISTLVYR